MTAVESGVRPAPPDAPVRETGDLAVAALVDRPSRLFDVVLPRLLLVVVPLLLVHAVARPVGDPDTFWHLRAGEQLLRTWSFLPTDDWSAFSTRPWVLHEWLPEVLMALAARVDGLAGVVVLHQVAVSGVALAVVACCRPRGTLLQCLIGATVALVGIAPSLGPRPQLASFVLLAVTLRAWLATADDRRPRWGLVALSWFWACCHGFWLLGPALGLVVVVGMVLDDRRDRTRWRADLQLLLVPVAAFAAGLLSPVGYHGLTAAFGVSDTAMYVTEWDSPSLRTPPVAIVVAALLAVAVVRVRRRTPWSWVRIGLWVLAAVACLTSQRTVALGALLMAPLVVECLAGLAGTTDHAGERATHRPAERIPRRARVEYLLGAATVLVVLVVAATTASGRPSSDVPTGLDPALDALPTGTVVYDWYDVGGYLDWAHPRLSLVIDGRTEIYDVSYVDAYVGATAAAPGWEATVARSGATAAVLRTDSPLGDALEHRSGWRVVAVADGYRLLQHP